VRSDIADSAEGSHLFTLSPNPLSIAAADATLDVVLEEELHINAEKVGIYLKKRLEELIDEHTLVGDVRGKGLIVGVELVKDKESKEPATKETAKVVYRAWELGLLTAYTGMYSNVIELTPPLIIDRKDADVAVDIIDRALKDVEEGRVPDEKLELFSGW
jgi:4-aminobutyrate aminotransferase